MDTREQVPWKFESLTTKQRGEEVPVVVEVLRQTLKQGDYSIEGHESDFAIERKSCDDLIRTIASGRQRFEKELGRMAAYRFACVIVEADWADTLQHCQIASGYNPVSLDSTILTFMMRYNNVHWIWRPDRYTAAKTAFKLMDLYWRKYV